MPNKKQEITAKYSNVLKHWHTKTFGPKPTIEQLAVAHSFCRPGKEALAIAMNLRDGGASTAQIIAACAANWGSSGTHNNKREKLITQKYAKKVTMADDQFGHTVYKIALTEKGEAKVGKKPVQQQETVAQAS